MKGKRGAMGLSLRDITKLFHIYIRDIEGERSVPSLEMAIKILSVYRTGIDELLREAVHVPPDIESASMGGSKSVPVISWSQAGNWREICDKSFCTRE